MNPFNAYAVDNSSLEEVVDKDQVIADKNAQIDRLQEIIIELRLENESLKDTIRDISINLSKSQRAIDKWNLPLKHSRETFMSVRDEIYKNKNKENFPGGLGAYENVVRETPQVFQTNIKKNSNARPPSIPSHQPPPLKPALKTTRRLSNIVDPLSLLRIRPQPNGVDNGAENLPYLRHLFNMTSESAARKLAIAAHLFERHQRCEICGITVISPDVFIRHIVGQKHIANIGALNIYVPNEAIEYWCDLLKRPEPEDD